MPTFSAVLLAGGKSQRMGRDKALLPLPGDQLLWQRQLRVLEALRPEKMYWSGPAEQDVPEHICVIADPIRNAGPLAGITAALETLSTDLLVVLAIDMPQMNAAYLRDLAGRCTASRGAVPHHGEFFEPLAAIYPKLVHELAADRLRQGRYTLQEFVREAVRRELVEAVPIHKGDVAKFANVNTPQDLDRIT